MGLISEATTAPGGSARSGAVGQNYCRSSRRQAMPVTLLNRGLPARDPTRPQSRLEDSTLSRFEMEAASSPSSPHILSPTLRCRSAIDGSKRGRRGGQRQPAVIIQRQPAVIIQRQPVIIQRQPAVIMQRQPAVASARRCSERRRR
jgi:hypothetical protein